MIVASDLTLISAPADSAHHIRAQVVAGLSRYPVHAQAYESSTDGGRRAHLDRHAHDRRMRAQDAPHRWWNSRSREGGAVVGNSVRCDGVAEDRRVDAAGSGS